MFLSIHDLVQFTGGQLRLASMPPLEGAWVQVPRIVLDSTLVERGDLFWQVNPQGCDTQLAFLRGAFGIVTGGRHVEPWPGTFCLCVDNAIEALDRLVQAMEAGLIETAPARFVGEEAFAADELPLAVQTEAPVTKLNQESLPTVQELKVLQLCGPRGVVTFPPTCGQSAKGQIAERCRRRAA